MKKPNNFMALATLTTCKVVEYNPKKEKLLRGIYPTTQKWHVLILYLISLSNDPFRWLERW